jgi:hypothetical protein
MLKVISITLVVLLVFTGCSTMALTANVKAAQSAPNPLAGLAAFTIADLQAADATAVAGGDLAGHACYPVLVQVIQQVQAQQKATGTAPAGPISLFEAARVLVKTGPGSVQGLAQQVNVGCAALFVDSQVTIANIAALGAAIGVK